MTVVWFLTSPRTLLQHFCIVNELAVIAGWIKSFHFSFFRTQHIFGNTVLTHVAATSPYSRVTFQEICEPLFFPRNTMCILSIHGRLGGGGHEFQNFSSDRKHP